ncbi:transporter substrate-binding domain-containing protein [Rhizobium sp. L1K21]|uniref:transporter substrate-binding domain-containing protein n=1 Tax=Rhizobium sp. L1K21 TaxID=2954933 RepID=UPI002091EE6E|nr:transporter substrate-binding domain-containing protein [Rhizobium sp. L1K21]MCO6187184.1 transporter substrate-binding domain-containing protein [Rhizobium sp. L1K21]
MIVFFALSVFFGGPVARADGLPLTVNVQEHRAIPDISNVPRIRFLTTADFPPFSFADASGKLSGFNIDLVRAICRELKVEDKCQIQVLPFGELEGALDARAGEAVIAGVAVTAKLRERFDFSRSYMALPARFLANAEKAGNVEKPEDLKKSEIGVIATSAEAGMLKAFFPALKAKPFETRQLMFEALKTGDIPAAFTSGLQAEFWRNSKAADGCCRALGGPYYSRYFLGEGMTIMTRKDQPLAKAFDAALVALAANGTLDELYIRYFPAGL